MQTGFYKNLATKYSTLFPKSTRATNLFDSNNALHASKNDKSERVLEWCCGIYTQFLLKYVHSHSLTSSKPRASRPSLIYMADGTHRLIRDRCWLDEPPGRSVCCHFLIIFRRYLNYVWYLWAGHLHLITHSIPSLPLSNPWRNSFVVNHSQDLLLLRSELEKSFLVKWSSTKKPS